MRHIIQGLSFLLIPIIVRGCLSYSRQPKKEEKGKVHLPGFLAIVGLICSVFFLIPAILTSFLDEPIWVPIGFFLLSLIGASLIIMFLNCRIYYDEEGFVVKSFFGIKRKYTYDQVTAIKIDKHEDYIYVGKRRFSVSFLSANSIDFILLVIRKYKKLKNGQELPEIHKTKYDIFNGNIYNSEGFLLCFILLGAIVLGFLALTIYLTFVSSTVDNTIEHSVRFVSYDIEGDEPVLISEDNQIFKVMLSVEQFNVKNLKSLCDRKEIITTYSHEVTPDDEEDYYSVKAIKYNDSYLVSFEETNSYRRQKSMPVVIFAAVICLAVGTIIAGWIIVGRNPKKFSKRVIRFFFKDGYIKD